MSDISNLGSPDWVEWVFATPPVRDLAGRSHAAHRQALTPTETGRFTAVEGRESPALMAILYLINKGVVRRVKEQPFTVVDGDEEYTPDFLMELTNGRLVVVEAKASRYLTRLVEARLERLDGGFQACGLILLLWTDKHPLSDVVRTNLESLYYASHDPQPEAQCSALYAHITTHGAQTATNLIDAGYELNVALDLCWRDRLHFDLTQPLTLLTEFGLRSYSNLTEMLLAARPRLAAWWNGLPDA